MQTHAGMAVSQDGGAWQRSAKNVRGKARHRKLHAVHSTPQLSLYHPRNFHAGVAVSQDGVEWRRSARNVKGKQGSAAVSDVGATIGPNVGFWWTFDTCHVAVSDVQVRVCVHVHMHVSSCACMCVCVCEDGQSVGVLVDVRHVPCSSFRRSGVYDVCGMHMHLFVLASECASVCLGRMWGLGCASVWVW